jgi:hypothetical protein
LVFLAGFYSPEEGDRQNFFLMVGVSALVGMFSQQAVEKLKKISEAILTSVQPSADKGPGSVSLREITPETGASAGHELITLTGAGFAAGAVVTFGGIRAVVKKVAPTTIEVLSPPYQVKGKVDVHVSNPDGGTVGMAGGFEYT